MGGAERSGAFLSDNYYIDTLIMAKFGFIMVTESGAWRWLSLVGWSVG